MGTDEARHDQSIATIDPLFDTPVAERLVPVAGSDLRADLRLNGRDSISDDQNIGNRRLIGVAIVVVYAAAFDKRHFWISGHRFPFPSAQALSRL
jgi:hypothetical protein